MRLNERVVSFRFRIYILHSHSPLCWCEWYKRCICLMKNNTIMMMIMLLPLMGLISERKLGMFRTIAMWFLFWANQPATVSLSKQIDEMKATPLTSVNHPHQSCETLRHAKLSSAHSSVDVNYPARTPNEHGEQHSGKQRKWRLLMWYLFNACKAIFSMD